MNDGVIVIVLTLLSKCQGIGVVGLDTYTWGIKDFHKCWSGSLAKRRLCLGPAGVINCISLSKKSARPGHTLFQGDVNPGAVSL